MLEKPFDDLTMKIEPGVSCCVIFEKRHDSVRLLIVLKVRSLLPHPCIKCILAAVTEGWVTQVMCERDALRQIFIESQSSRQVPADRRDLHRVRQARAEMITFSRDEDLRLPLEPSKRLGMNDAIAIALKRKPHRIFGLWVDSPESSLMGNGVWSQKGIGLSDVLREINHTSRLRHL